MKEFELKDYKVFDMFNNQWGLVTAGNIEHYNTCTIAWGSLGTIWGGPGRGRPIVTVYVNPDRYTYDFLKEGDTFTVQFFSEKYRPALSYLGTRSGRDEDKVTNAGLTPAAIAEGVTFEEAELTFVCHKLYQGEFQREGLAPEINHGIYKNWHPHWMFVGEILEVQDKRDQEDRNK
jgi:flavin reductase (DIM6/NTAB) family NADH-FMN oxidoreductase RutF